MFERSMSVLTPEEIDYIHGQQGEIEYNKWKESVLRKRKPYTLKEIFDLEEVYAEEEAAASAASESATSSLSSSSALLPAAESAVSGAASATAASSSVGPVGAVVIGGSLVAAGAGLYNQARKTGVQVPTTRYVGPGNPLDNGPPSSFADEDAREHDITYSVANADVSDSDSLTIRKFGDHIADDNLDPTSIIGYTGLQVKKQVEKHTGQLYPSKYKWLLIKYMTLEKIFL